MTSNWGSRKRWLVAGMTLLAIAAFACGDDDDPDADATRPAGATAAATAGSDTDYSSLSGDIVIDGSSTVGPITEAIAEEFGKESDVRVAVGISGTGGGFEKFCKGETDINDASRPIKKDDAKEGAACAAANIEYVEFKVAIDALTVVVNPDNEFAQCLTFSQLKKIWDTGSTVQNWNEVDPSFPDQPLKLYGPGADSGTFDYFTEAVNGTVDQSRADYTASEDDNQLVQGVQNDPNALGYFGYAYFQESRDALKAVQVDKDQDGKGTPVAADKAKGCVSPSEDTVNDASYPLSRPLFIYVSKKALARPEVKGFVQYYLENAPELVADVGYIALPDADYTAGLGTLAAN